MRALVEANTHILRPSQCFGNAAFTKDAHMKKTLTLKSISKNIATHDSTALPIQIQARRQPKKGHPKACVALTNQLNELIDSGSKVFIQMRHGTGYCGLPTKLDDGWLTMAYVSVHGTKQTVSSQSILIQIHDGSFIAHLHPVDSTNNTGA